MLKLYFKSKLGNILGILKGIQNNIINISVSTTLLKNKASQMLCVFLPSTSLPHLYKRLQLSELVLLICTHLKIVLTICVIHMKCSIVTYLLEIFILK